MAPFLEHDLVAYALDAIAKLAPLDGGIVMPRYGGPARTDPQLLGCRGVHAPVGKMPINVVERPLVHAFGPRGAILVHEQQQPLAA